MENEILLYSDENGKINVSVYFVEEDVWVTAVQPAELYATTRQEHQPAYRQHLQRRRTSRRSNSQGFLVSSKGRKS